MTITTTYKPPRMPLELLDGAERDRNMANESPTTTTELPGAALNDDADRQTSGEPEAAPEAAATAVVAEDRVATLERHLARLTAQSETQDHIIEKVVNMVRRLNDSVETLASTELITRDAVHTTNCRMRVNVNVTENTKGYSYDTTFEVASDDPTYNFALAMDIGLREADNAARAEIANRQYVDVEGLPGSDDTPIGGGNVGKAMAGEQAA